MSVEIIGEVDSAKREATCPNCASRLRYALCDTRTTIEKDYGGGSDSYRYLRCPRCLDEFKVALY